MIRHKVLPNGHFLRRCFSTTARRREVKSLEQLQDRIYPSYTETKNHDLLCLQWPSPPRNVLLTKKNNSPSVTDSLIEFAKHISSSYPDVSIILEPHAATEVHESLPFPVYAGSKSLLPEKVDLVSTFGGDGTILHASSLFATCRRVPPVLSFSMGTLGFLGEWKFKEYKRAFREVYMSGASDAYGSTHEPELSSSADTSSTPHKHASQPTGWSSIRGRALGSHRGARILLRNRLKIGVFGPDGTRFSGASSTPTASASASLPESATMTTNDPHDVYALNEIILHRGADPHLAIISVFIGGRFLTEAVADGMIISTPTGSTAYSLSSGGSIVHPLVSSLLLTPVCPRSLSFRPLVLPANTPITLRLSEKNRGREVELSVDGVRRPRGVGVGMEVRVWGEEIRGPDGGWNGGVPSVVRGAVGGGEGGGGGTQDHWVGGLNGLLGFNYPFGEREGEGA
ncbi:hypothetical protein LTS18_002694 [Coniosporium uncinatum]|uniref:Uncharacterized protein n=1 Tax=Coniosporium uncinatum TaxID=93489 RepID=A0ACC3DCV4_9PEZI|nr:hypothetical protein LTS18_002694 [Coniosporium uncinatum]